MGNLELLLILIVALLVIGPERLPETVRTLGLWFGRLRRSFLSIKTEIEKEVGMDDIRRQLHNEAVMEEMRRIESEVKNSIQEPGPQATENPDQAEAAVKGDASIPSEPEGEKPAEAPAEETPRPRSEAELEALHARRAKQAAGGEES